MQAALTHVVQLSSPMRTLMLILFSSTEVICMGLVLGQIGVTKSIPILLYLSSKEARGLNVIAKV